MPVSGKSNDVTPNDSSIAVKAIHFESQRTLSVANVCSLSTMANKLPPPGESALSFKKNQNNNNKEMPRSIGLGEDWCGSTSAPLIIMICALACCSHKFVYTVCRTSASSAIGQMSSHFITSAIFSNTLPQFHFKIHYSFENKDNI